MAASLSALPPETLDVICKSLCLHCQSDPSTFSHGRLPDRAIITSYRNDLAALSRSCRQLHLVATPYLYHWPHPRPLYAIHLICTLSERPNLAQHVKTLRLWHEEWHLHQADVDIWGDGSESFRNLIASREIIHAPTGDEKPCPRVDATWGSDQIPDLCLHQIAGALALSYTPNIETLEIASRKDKAIPFPRAVTFHQLRNFKYTSGSGRHDTSATLERVALLTPRMPALNVFRASNLRVIRTPNFPHRTVTELYLHDVAVGDRELGWLMCNSFVNVRLFSWTRSYITVGGIVQDYAQEDILNVLSGERKPLEHLVLNIDGWVDLRTAGERLSCLEGLQSLDISGIFSDNWTERDEEPDEGYDSSKGQPMMRYANLLPQSIRAVSFGISRVGSFVPYGKDMLYLARHGRRLFPQLEMVRLKCETVGDVPAERLCKEFEANGVSAQRGEDDLWMYL